jgi:hypothetical protein
MLREICIEGNDDPVPTEADPDKRMPVVRQALYTDVSALIFGAMAHHSVSQVDLGARIGCETPTTVARALKANNLRLSTIADIADALGYRVKVSFVAMGEN